MTLYPQRNSTAWKREFLPQVGGGTPLVVRAQSFAVENNTATLTFDKTWQEVHDAIANGVPCYIGCLVGTSVMLCNIQSITDLSTCMIPIYEAYESNGVYELNIAMDGVYIDQQASPDSLMTSQEDCGLS